MVMGARILHRWPRCPAETGARRIAEMDQAELTAEKDAIFDLLTELAAIDGVAGFEGPVVRRLVEHFRPLADEVQVDRFGNVIATVRGGDAADPTLMLAAHSDEIGGGRPSFAPGGM